MKQILYFLIGFCISVVWGCQYAYADCVDMTSFESYFPIIYSNYEHISIEYFDNQASAEAALSSFSASGYSVRFSSLGQSYSGVSYCILGSKKDGFYDSRHTVFVYAYGVDPCSPDSDDDGIPDGLDAYPDTDSAYQFRIMVNYFDSEGNCVAQLSVTSSGDYVLLGDLTAGEIKAGVVDGTYNSDFVNSPIWIESSDLENDDASDIYASGDSTTSVTSTTASGLSDSATTANAGNLSTADSVASGSTYDSSSDTDSSALGKIVDNTAATTSNQQTLANYAKKQAELQAANNTLQSGQLDQLAKMNDTLEDQAETAAEEQKAQKKEIDEGKTALEGLDIDSLLGEDISGELLEGEGGDYQDHGELMEETWVQELISSNPIMTVLTDSGFEYSNGSPTATLDLGELGSHILDISHLEAGFIAFGNLLVSFTTLIGLVHVITGRGF